MTTTSDMIHQTRRDLLGGGREELNKLSAGITADATSITFAFEVGGIQAGSVISIELEKILVWTVSGSDTASVVQRGYMGTTAATHSINTIVRVNSAYDDFDIFTALNHDISDLSSPANGLFRVLSVDQSYSAATSGYNLTSATDVIDVLDVDYTAATGSYRRSIEGVRLERHAPTADFASGLAVMFTTDFPDPGRSFRVTYKAPFASLSTTMSADVAVATGMPISLHDIPPLGAAARLLAPNESWRNRLDAEPGSRRDDAVPAGAIGNTARLLFAQRQSRIANEAARLMAAYPQRIGM